MELTNFKFKDWFFSLLPFHFKLNDTYKDTNGEGILERFLRNPGDEIDEQVIPFIEGYIAATSLGGDPKFLTHIAYTLGNPPDLWLGNDNTKYDLFLQHVVSIYKIKGTIKSYELMFLLLGYIVTIVEYPEYVPAAFDSGGEFDSGLYFDGKCPTCSDYSIFITPANVDCYNPQLYVITQQMIDLFWLIIKWLEPINAHLIEFTPLVTVCDDVNACIDEHVTAELYSVPGFDLGNDFDDGNEFEQYEGVMMLLLDTDNCSGIPPGDYSYDDYNDDFY